ncbi:MAG: TraB/GumN family protein [Pseudomonadota bacterium]
MARRAERRTTAALTALMAASFAGGSLRAQDLAPTAPSATEWSDNAVAVHAHRRGPPLWRVSKGNSEVWVLATPSAAVLQDWDASALERLFDTVKVVKTAPQAHVDLLGAAWFLLKGDYRLPRDQTLIALLGPEDWNRLAGHLRAAGADPDDYKHLRPGFATVMVWSQAMKARKAIAVSDRVGRLAEKRHLTVKPVADYPAGPLLAKVAALSPVEATACLRLALDDLDFARDHLAPASAAWAEGDLAGLRQHYRPERGFECIARTSGLSGAVERSVSDTAHDIDAAMTGPPTLFVLNLASFVRKGGVMDALRAQGYVVEEPGG